VCLKSVVIFRFWRGDSNHGLNHTVKNSSSIFYSTSV